jgi:hypothetical protein
MILNSVSEIVGFVYGRLLKRIRFRERFVSGSHELHGVRNLPDHLVTLQSAAKSARGGIRARFYWYQLPHAIAPESGYGESPKHHSNHSLES